MFIQRLFPFAAAPKKQTNSALDISSINVSNVFKIRTLGLSFNNGFSSYLSDNRGGRKRANFEESPYDFGRILEAIDTDSYVKQGFAKYRELFWKEGWDIIGENDEAIKYLWQRLDLMEEVMKRPFNDFLMEVVDQLVKFGNVFIVESRGDIQPIFPGKLYPAEDTLPIAGYYIIPTETVRIFRNRNNKPLAYRQSLEDQSAYNDNLREPVWSASEVIHLYLDKKPGRAFGTPFLVSVLDDVIALRQIEEDIQNLIHKELFPLYKYRVGTEDRPSSPEEVEQAANELANLRVDGGLVIPERHDVEVIGADGNALDANSYLQQFKERVAVGMGLSPHHLGMLASGGNRSVTDRLDIALYDKIKLIQAYVEDAVRLFIFNPLLREGGFNPLVTPMEEGPSDRCYVKFREIDIDTQVKKEQHILNLFSNNIITLEEARLMLGRQSEFDPAQLLMAMTAQVQTLQQIAVQQHAPQTPTATGALPKAPSNPPTKPDAVKPSTGGVPNAPNTNKRSGNLVRPSNQFGRRNSPNIRHMDDSILKDIVEVLSEEIEYE